MKPQWVLDIQQPFISTVEGGFIREFQFERPMNPDGLLSALWDLLDCMAGAPVKPFTSLWNWEVGPIIVRINTHSSLPTDGARKL